MRKNWSVLKISAVSISTLFLLGYIIYPLYNLMAVGVKDSFGIHALFRKQVFQASVNSLLLSLVSVIGSGIIGTYFAYLFRYKKIPGKQVMANLVLLPIAIPPIVGVMAFLFLVGDNGLLMRLFGWKQFAFNGWPAMILIHCYSFYPLFYLFVGNALKSIDSSVVEASLILGANKNRTFFKVILPQLKIALSGAALLTFMASMASFSAPFIFGGSERFLTTEIYYSKINGDMSLSALLSLLLTVISLIGLIFFTRYNRKLPANSKTKGTIKKHIIAGFDNNNRLTFVIAIIFIGIILLPMISLFLLSFLPDGVLMEAGGTGLHFTLDNYRKLFSGSDFLQPMINSIEASFLAVLMALLIGLLIAHLIRGKKHFYLKSLMETVSSIPYGVPGTVIAIGLILCYNQPSVFSFQQILVGTFWILPIAYAIRNLPVITQSIKAGLQSVDISIEEAAGALGAGAMKVWQSVTFPLISSSIIEGSLLVLINSFGEFVATVLLYTYSTKTMPVEVYAQLRMYNNGLAATYGLILFLVVVVLIIISRKISTKDIKL